MLIEQNTACCFTGHRHIKADRAELEKRTVSLIEKSVEDGYRTFIAGGAVGFDCLAALCVLRLKASMPDKGIRLILFLPGKNQTARWNEANKLTYDRILRCADGVVYIDETCSSEAYLKRDRSMVDASSRVIAYLEQPAGLRSGTAYTVRYAEKAGREILYA